MRYIHYGHSEFDDKLFSKISNRDFFVKPNGGLWACGLHYDYVGKNGALMKTFQLMVLIQALNLS